MYVHMRLCLSRSDYRLYIAADATAADATNAGANAGTWM